MRFKVPAIALVTSVVAAAALSACGSSGTNASSTSTQSGTPAASTPGSKAMTIKLGIGPVADFGQYFVAAKEGYFKKLHLNVTTSNVLSGPEGLSAVKSGHLDLTYSAAEPLFLADQSGLGLKFIGPGDVESAGHWQFYAMAKPGSGITSFSQAFANGNKVGWIGSGPVVIAIRLLLKQMNLATSSISLVTLPVPDITTALKSSEVKVALPLEPFTAIALATKVGVKVGGPLDAIMGSTVVTGGYIASPSWASSHAAAVSAFNKAMAEATTFINSHQSQAQAIIGAALKLPPAIAKAVPSIHYVAALPSAAVQTQITQAHQVGLLSSSLSAKDVLNP